MKFLSQTLRRCVSSVLIVFILGGTALPYKRVEAAAPFDFTGYAWSDTIGWISLNCANTASCATSSYKVTLDTTTNNLTGYAWSDNIGWVEFGGPNSTTGCPTGTCPARKSGGSLLGWARALNGDGVNPTVTTPGTTTYATAGAQSFTVPAGVTSLTAALTGAGGSPATTSAIAVTPGEVLTATVGAGGAATRLKRGVTTLASGSGSGGAVTFAGKVDYTTNVAPDSIALGDVNGDGIADMVVTNYTGSTASVLLNNGNGTFAAKVDYTTGTGPFGIALGDVNGDGKPDIMAADYGANTASVLLNNGNGTFAAKVDYTTGPFPISVAVADVNGDSKADIVTTNYGSGTGGGTTASVLLNNGNGTFARNVDYTTGTSPIAVALGDVNGDGKADMVVANYTSTSASVLLNNGAGTFAPKVDYTTGTNPVSVALGDVNGDGKADMATANKNSGSGTTASVLLNNGDGTFAPKTDFTTGTGPRFVALGDLNGDGMSDMVVANSNGGSGTTASVLLNNGDGTFAPKTDFTTGTGVTSVALGDVNGDGKADMVTANYAAGAGTTASVLLNTTPSSLGKAIFSYTATNPVPPNGSDGWISLSSANGGGSTYGVTIGTNSLGGFAWGSEVMGWIDFSAVSFPPPCSISNICSIDHTQSINTDAWCTITTTTCSAGYICKDAGGLCGAGNPSGTMTFSNQKVKKGKTVTISWNVLYADSCVVSGTNGDSWTPASSSVKTSQALQNEATYTLNCQPVGGGTPVLLDTKKVTLIPKIGEF